MLVTTKYCEECQKFTNHYNGECGICEQRKLEQARKQHFEALDAMTLADRVRRIENILYAQSMNLEMIDHLFRFRK